jgi:hypothetical protein
MWNVPGTKSVWTLQGTNFPDYIMYFDGMWYRILKVEGIVYCGL